MPKGVRFGSSWGGIDCPVEAEVFSVSAEMVVIRRLGVVCFRRRIALIGLHAMFVNSKIPE